MFDAAALVLEEIAPEDKTRNEVLGARVNLYMAAKKCYLPEHYGCNRSTLPALFVTKT